MRNLHSIIIFALVGSAFCVPCTWTKDPNTGKYYDLTGMISSSFYLIPKNTYPNQVRDEMDIAESEQQWDVYINVCDPISQPTCGTGVIACQVWDPTNGGEEHYYRNNLVDTVQASLGQASTQKFQTAVSPGKNGYGVTLEYTAGDLDRQTEINFACDPDVTTISPPAYTGENPPHHYTFLFKNKWGCPVDNCADGVDCRSCVSQKSNCSWCLDSKRCTFRSDKSCQNYVTNPKYCPPGCEVFTSCDTCTSNSCAWCLDSKTCVPKESWSCPDRVVDKKWCTIRKPLVVN